MINFYLKNSIFYHFTILFWNIAYLKMKFKWYLEIEQKKSRSSIFSFFLKFMEKKASHYRENDPGLSMI